MVYLIAMIGHNKPVCSISWKILDENYLTDCQFDLSKATSQLDDPKSLENPESD
jgi:hypothetical protein